MTSIRSFSEGHQVGPPGQHGGLAAQSKGVLLLQADLGAMFLPPFGRPGQQGGVLALPLSHVEVGGMPVEVLVVRLEPDGPLAGAVADEQAG